MNTLTCLLILASSALAESPTDADARAAVAVSLSRRVDTPPVCCCTKPSDCDCGKACACTRCNALPSNLRLVVVCTSPCEPCERMKAGLRSEAVGIEGIMPDDAATARQYGVTQFPTVILLRDGKEITRRVGYATVPDLAAWIKASQDNTESYRPVPLRTGPQLILSTYSTLAPTFQASRVGQT